MKLDIPFIEAENIEEAQSILNKIQPQVIKNEPWPLPGANPEVQFVIAHGKDALFLKYRVTERYAIAKYTNINESVWEDSCVEFFIAFNDEEAYYNFEFNCIGTVLLGHGAGKDRFRLPAGLIRKISTQVMRMPDAANPELTHWELTVAIPFEVFQEHNLSSLKNIKARGNFYKCGDELPEPHFLTWNNITAEKPNFHLPEFFGELIFE